MGQCTSKHGRRNEGANAPALTSCNIKRNSVDQHPVGIQEADTLPLYGNESTISRHFVDNQVCLSSTEDDNYSSDFCEEDDSFATANSSKSMINATSRKTSSGASRKSPSITPSSFSLNKRSVTSTPTVLSSLDNRPEDGGSSMQIHDVVKKRGCEMFVIDFDDDKLSCGSPDRKTPSKALNKRRTVLQPSSKSNSHRKGPQTGSRGEEVIPCNSKATAALSSAMSPNSRHDIKRTKLNTNDESGNSNSNYVSYVGFTRNKAEEVSRKSDKSKQSRKGALADIVYNEKLKKDMSNKTIKSQNSSKRIFLRRKKSKQEDSQKIQENVGK